MEFKAEALGEAPQLAGVARDEDGAAIDGLNVVKVRAGFEELVQCA